MMMLFFIVSFFILLYCDFELFCFIYRWFKIAYKPSTYHRIKMRNFH